MMPQRFGFRSLALTAALLATAATAHAQGRIAYVRGDEVLRATPGYAAADSQWRKRVDQYNADFGKMQAKFDSAGQKFQDTSPMLTATARAAAQKNLETLQDSLNKLSTYYQQRSQQDKQEVLGPLEDRITAVLDGLRAEGNFDYIFDMTVLQNGGAILSANKSLDLTAKAIDRLTGTPAKKPGGV